MPRPLNKRSCNTCRRRKLKCSEDVPVCRQCRTSRRYCDRSERPLTIVQCGNQGKGTPVSPRALLKDQRIASLFQSYIVNIAPWYDLADAAQSFSKAVPLIALDEPLLFHALIALSAMHSCKTSAASLRSMAEAYHTSCARFLVALEGDDPLMSRGVALAATCLLRSYEILNGQDDPNMHLRGAYSMASIPDLISESYDHGLLESGFWNYLREDITFSLFEQCPLKMDLESAHRIFDHRTDEDYLNSISLILGRILNVAFGNNADEWYWTERVNELRTWFLQLPKRLLPFSKSEQDIAAHLSFPAIWFLRSCHASALHYYLVSVVIMLSCAPSDLAGELLSLDYLGHEALPVDDTLEHLAVEICGIAFTAKTPSVIVNAFGPIAYTCQFIRHQHWREELERQLIACKKDIGWPVERLVSNLRDLWVERTSSNAVEVDF